MDDKHMMHRVVEWLYQRHTIDRGYLIAERACGFAFGMTKEGAELIYDFLEYYFEPLLKETKDLEKEYPDIPRDYAAARAAIRGRVSGFTRHLSAQNMAKVYRQEIKKQEES
jgi:hypothetical protein